MDGGDSAGGSTGLANLIDDYGEYLLADFQSHYGLNLVAAARPGSGYSPRHLLLLAKQLPLTSATVAAIRGGSQYRGWDAAQYLRAETIDAIRENTYAFIAANSKRKPKAPEPIPRPEMKERKKDNTFRMMAAERIAAARKAKGG